MIHLLLQKSPFNIGLILTLLLLAQDILAQRSFKQMITPRHLGLQYAGSIGYMSVGLGYDVSKNTLLSLHYGYVPEVKGGELHIAALKLQYNPFHIPLGKTFLFEPLNPMVFASYTFSNKLVLRFDPDQYPDSYYFWSPALREHLGLTTELQIRGDQSSKIKSISLYTESNTNDLYLVSWYKNRTKVPFYKIFRLGFGVRINF
jgi:hypothetical protein